MEIWKEVKDTNGLYFVSNLGRVKRKKILKPTVMSVGYTSVALSVNGKTKREYVHKLVISAFERDPQSEEVIHHKNDNKQDNRLENLEIVSRSYNAKCFAKQNKRTKYSSTKPEPWQKVKPSDCNWAQIHADYEISDSGLVWSVKRKQLLKPGTNLPGYHYYHLRMDGGSKNFSAHRLVAQHFIGYVDGMVVDHINGDKLDNRVENLRIITHAENISHSKNAIRKAGKNGFKLNREDVKKIKTELSQGIDLLTIAKKFGISKSHVSSIKRGKCWKHV